MIESEAKEIFRKWNLYFRKNSFEHKYLQGELYISDWKYFSKCDILFFEVYYGEGYETGDEIILEGWRVKNICNYKESEPEKPKEGELFA